MDATIKLDIAYDLETGVFTRLTTANNKSKAGDIATHKTSHGYLEISYKSKSYYAHRLAWWYVYGVWPTVSLDHINQNKKDNRVCNLREVTNKENMQNVDALIKSNTSGYAGVYKHTKNSKWIANIVVNKKTIYIGSFKTSEEANEARIKIKRELHPYWVESPMGQHN